MADTEHRDPKQYLVARVQEALAQDPRVGSLDIRVKVVDEQIFLTGSVPTAERARAAADAAAAVCPDYSVHNDLEVWTAPASSGHDEPEALT